VRLLESHENTKATFVGHWFRTGDKYVQDQDGYFWHAGRADDLFKVNGLWLSPAEVESALIAHPAVLEAAVIARDDDAGLTKPAAYIVTKPEFTPSAKLARDLQAWVGDRIAATSAPGGSSFSPKCPKPLPENSSASSCAKDRRIPAGRNARRNLQNTA